MCFWGKQYCLNCVFYLVDFSVHRGSSKTMSDKIVNIRQKSNYFQDHAFEFLKSCIHLFLAVLRLYCSAGLSLVLLCGLVSGCSEQGLPPSCGVQASHCSGFPLWSTGCRACRLQWQWHRFCNCGSLALEHRLSSCGTWA